jgi:hypothetical protein
MASEVISALNKIHGRAAHACDSAPKCMDARWAKDYVSGTHAARQREMLDIQSKGKYAGYNNEGGVGLIVRSLRTYLPIASARAPANSLLL